MSVKTRLECEAILAEQEDNPRTRLVRKRESPVEEYIYLLYLFFPLAHSVPRCPSSTVPLDSGLKLGALPQNSLTVWFCCLALTPELQVFSRILLHTQPQYRLKFFAHYRIIFFVKPIEPFNRQNDFHN